MASDGQPRGAREILMERYTASVMAEAQEPINRVLELCDRWDAMTKGESSVTMQIRAAIQGES